MASVSMAVQSHYTNFGMAKEALVLQAGLRLFRLGLHKEERPRVVLHVGLEIDRCFQFSPSIDCAKEDHVWLAAAQRILSRLTQGTIELLVAEHPVVLVQAENVPKPMRDALIRTLLRTHACKAVYPMSACLAALHCQALNTGLVIDIGYRTVTAAAVAFGQIQTRSCTRFHGRGALLLHTFLANRLVKPLEEIEMDTNLHQSLICHLKRPRSSGEEPWLWQAAEIFFNDEYLEVEAPWPTLQEIAAEAIEKSGTEIRALVAQNIVIIGGPSDIPGFKQRFAFELLEAMSTIDACRGIPLGRYGFGVLPCESSEASYVGGCLADALA